MLIKRVSIAIMILIGVNASAQKIKVQETNAYLGGSKNAALEVIVYETDEEKVIKEWRSLMKGFNAKVSVNNEVFADNALIKLISENTVDVYAKTEKAGENAVKLIAAFDMGGAYLCRSMHKDQCKSVEKIMEDFAKELTLEGISDQYKAAKKVLGKLEDQRDGLISQQSRLERDIESYKEKIAKAESELVQNKSNQESKVKEVELQQKVTSAIEDKKKDFK